MHYWLGASELRTCFATALKLVDLRFQADARVFADRPQARSKAEAAIAPSLSAASWRHI